MKHRLFLLCIWAGCFAGSTTGQPPSSVSEELSRQYVFFVDTSFSMARQRQTVTQAISDLILNGLNGQMHAGDSFVIWTFNEEVETRRFVPHVWIAEHRQALAQRAGEFLKSLRYEKQTRMDKAMAEMRHAIQASQALTVILVTDGDTPISGTPFDRRINLLYSERGRDLRKIKRPFLTTLVTSNGQFLASVVSAAGEPIKIPETRPPVQTDPSIVSSTRPEPPAVKPATPQTEISPPPSAPPKETSVVQTNVPAIAPFPPASTKAAVVPDVSEPPIPNPPVTPSPVQPPTEASTPSTPPLNPKTESASPVIESAPTKNDLPAVPTPTARSESEPPIKETTQAARPSSDLAGAKAEKEKPTPEPGGASTPEESQLPPVDNAALATSAGPSNPQGYLVLGLALLLLVLGLVYWYVRNTRPPSQPSLISRSLDNRKK